MAEYTKAVVQGRPNFHISLIVDVSPNCDCHAENDAPILPNIGMFASSRDFLSGFHMLQALIVYVTILILQPRFHTL